MRLLRPIWSRLVATWATRADERRLREELDLHLELEADALERQGLSPDEARRQAALRLGGRSVTEEAWRDARRLPWLDRLGQDARYAARGLRRDWRFAVLAIGTLGVGIGMTTTIFGLLWGAVLSPMPYPEPERLVRIYQSSEQFPAFPLSPYSYLAYRRDGRALADLAVYTGEDLQLADGGQPEQLSALLVTASYFDVLGVRPRLGRLFTAADEKQNADVVVISEALWRRRFGADASIVGRRVRMSGRTFTVLGVLPAGFEHVGGAYRSLPQGETVDAWWPVPLDDAYARRGWHYLNAIGRLRPGATTADAVADLDRIERGLRLGALGGTNWMPRIVPLSDDVVGTARDGVMLLVAGVALLLVIACANVSSLLLARSTARVRERAVRVALGASRARLVAQSLTESAVIMVPAAAAACVLAWAGTDVLHAWLPADFPRLHNVRLDGGVLLFSIAVSAVAVVVFGLVPTWGGGADNADAALRGAKSSAGLGTTRLRQALVASEIALASALLVAGGLLAQSFVRLQRVAPGFSADRALTAVVTLPEARYQTPEKAARFYEALVREAASLPGVVAAGAGSDIPWTGYDENTGFDIVGRPAGGIERTARFHAATPGFFEAVGIAVVEGRAFDGRDREDAEPVLVVNQALARRYFPGESPVGRTIDLWDKKRTVVGVVADVKDQPADAEAVPGLWWPSSQGPRPSMVLTIRTASDHPGSMTADLRRLASRLDRELPLADIRTLEHVASSANAQRRFLLAVTLLFAGVAIGLAALGAYGVLSWTVRQRTRELGIRMALGADRRTVLGHVLGQGLRLAAIGLGAGLVLAFASGRIMARLLYGLSPHDAATFAIAALTVIVMSGFATLGPAITATRTSPVDALREE